MDQSMSTESKSPLLGVSNSLDYIVQSTVTMDVKPTKYTSWAEEVLRDEYGLDSSKPQSWINSSTDSVNEAIVKHEPADDIEIKEEKSQDREISIDFIDSVNEQKFVRLIKEEKLKTPFKRRHSQTPTNSSRSNSPISSNSDENPCGSRRRGSSNSYKDEKRLRHNSYNSSSSSSSYTESDPAVLVRRQKQIDYGKNTTAYDRYIELVPRSKRTRDHPRTPNKYGKYSRRAFDGLVKIWRKQLHYYDPPTIIKDEVNELNGSSGDDSDSE